MQFNMDNIEHVGLFENRVSLSHLNSIDQFFSIHIAI